MSFNKCLSARQCWLMEQKEVRQGLFPEGAAKFVGRGSQENKHEVVKVCKVCVCRSWGRREEAAYPAFRRR